jgi:hypothetical protein
MTIGISKVTNAVRTGASFPAPESAHEVGMPRFDPGGPDRGLGEIHAPGENETHPAGLLRPGRAPGVSWLRKYSQGVRPLPRGVNGRATPRRG